jgi:pSer/pThr/pTyr-binding forkhead associated (FHA) protein
VGLDGPTAGQRFDLELAGASIGRDSGSQIAVNDGSVSRKHAYLREEAAGFVIRDEGSANGVFVNGSRITEQVLRTGDTVQIGRVRFRFEER